MRRITRYVLYLSCCLFFSTVAMAQAHKVTGKVTDQNGQGIPGASVFIKGAGGVSADDNGVFSINVSPGNTLIISATGYSNSQIKVGAKTDLSVIALAKSNKVLEEVVVTALGQSQNKAKLGYSTATFGTGVINKNGATGMLQGLEGKVAGAEISDLGGPGSSTKVILRGYGIVSGGSNQPLYVIDGVPLSDGSFLTNSGSGTTGASNTDAVDFGNGMNNVNPNDIESITILKGTAASALYGGLARNGAIMITTKKGRAGKLKVEYDGSFDFSKVGKLPDYQSEFGQGWGGLFVASENGSWGPKLDGQQRLWGNVVDNSQLIKPFSFIKDNLRDFYQTGHDLNNSISLSGGNEANQFYFSYGNVSSAGVVPENANSLERNTVSLRTNSKFDKFTLGTSLNYVNQNLSVPGAGQGTSQGGGVFQSVLQIPVDVPIKDFADINNKFFNTDNYFTPYAENPYFALKENGNVQGLDRFFGNLNLGYKFNSHFNAQFKFGGDVTNSRTSIWKQPAAADPNTGNGSPATNVESFSRTPDVGEVGEGSDYLGTLNTDLILHFNQDLTKDLDLEALAGGNYYQEVSRGVFTQVTNLVIPSFFNLSNTSKPPTTTNGTSDEKKMGLYAQAIFGFKKQVYLTGTLRNDWTSTLPIDHNSIFYPGANISWIVSQLFNQKTTVSFLKLGMAYGKTGYDPAPYEVYSTLGAGSITLPPLGTLIFPFNGTSGFDVSNQINSPNLKPIFTTEFEGSVEARFFKDRIGIEATVYDRKTQGQIFPVQVAPSTGYATLVENLGQVSNKGIELTLNVTPVQSRNFDWNFTYTFARNWNNVDNLNGAAPDQLLSTPGEFTDAELRAVVGKTVASIYTVVPQKSPTGQIVVNPQSGLPLPNLTPLDAFGLTKGYMGSGLYDYTMGLTNTFSYKEISLSFSFDFRYGGVMYSETADLVNFVGNGITTTYNDRRPFIIPNSVNAVTGAGGQTTYVPNTTVTGAVTNITPGGTLNEVDQTYNYYSEGSSYSGGSDAMRIIDKSFLKLRDINLSYALPKNLLSKIKGTSASIGVYARNILLWTPKSNVYVDPEATDLGNDLAGQMGEFASAPLTKNYGIILKVIF